MSIKDEYPKLELRGKYYRIKDYVDGQRLRISTKTTFRLEAERVLDEYKVSKLSKDSKQQSGIVIFDKVAIMFIEDKQRQCKAKTLGNYKFILKSLLYFFSTKDMNSLKRIDIKQFEDLERLKNVSDGLLRKKLILLQSIFKYALELEVITNNPFANYSFRKQLKDYKARERFFSPSECQSLIGTIRESKNDSLERLVIFALETGLRVGELMNILFTDLAFEKGNPVLNIRKEISKSNRNRLIPLSRLAHEEILKQRQSFPASAFIFTTPKGEAYRTLPKTALNNALEKAKLKETNVSFHTLRHTAGSLWLQGVNIDGTARIPVRIEVVSEILGHKDISFTKKVYAKFDKDSVIRGFIPNEVFRIG